MGLHEPMELALELVDLTGERADLGQLLARHARPCIISEGSQPLCDPLEHHVAIEAPLGQLRLELGAELEQMPAQPVLDPGALGYQLIAVV